MAGDWTYSIARRRFRSPTTGRFLSQAQVRRISEQFAAQQATALAALTAGLADGSLDVPSWERAARDRVKATHGAAYALGRGGVHVMGRADWDTVNRLALDQMRYLTRFARDIADGKLTERQIAARAQLYAHSSRQAFERGKAAAYDVSLPCYPADGGTACRARCHCSWIYTSETKPRRQTIASYTLGHSEHCPDCIARSIRYRRFIVRIESTEEAA